MSVLIPRPETPSDRATALSTIPFPVNTKITTQNSQPYKSFMPDGMVSLFQGQSLLEDAADVELEVGRMIFIRCLSTKHIAAIEKLLIASAYPRITFGRPQFARV
jgi:hypothetical protein